MRGTQASRGGSLFRPFRVEESCYHQSRVARASQLWAEGLNPFGIRPDGPKDVGSGKEAGEGAVHGFKARADSGNSLPGQAGRAPHGRQRRTELRAAAPARVGNGVLFRKRLLRVRGQHSRTECCSSGKGTELPKAFACVAFSAWCRPRCARELALSSPADRIDSSCKWSKLLLHGT